MLLTDTRLKHLKPTAKELNISDGRGSQLYCRIKPNGLKTFIFRYSYNGRASNISIGKYPELSLKSARAKAGKYKAMLAENVNPMAHKANQRIANKNTFAHMADDWIAIKGAEYSKSHKKHVWVLNLNVHLNITILNLDYLC